MKVSLLKNNLKTGLYIVERATSKNLNLPVLENVLISSEKNFLTLTTTDLETAIKCWVLSMIEKKGENAVPVKFLAAFINSLNAEKISLEEEGNFLSIVGEGFSTKIKSGQKDDFPLLPTFDGQTNIQIDHSSFVEGLKQVVETTAPLQARPELSGVCFNFQPQTLKIVATDSFRLAEKTIFLEKKENITASLIVPQKTIREIINILSERKGKLTLSFSKNHIVFEFLSEEVALPRIQIFSRLIEGEYPDYQEIIPKTQKTQVSVQKGVFLGQLKTAGLFCGKIKEIKLKISPKENMVQILSQSPEFGENKSSLAAKIKGDAAEVAFNWRFLVDGLLNIKSSEVSFELNGEEGPAILKPVGEQSYFYIVMPLKS